MTKKVPGQTPIALSISRESIEASPVIYSTDLTHRGTNADD